ncbi:LysM repeat protein [Pelomonas saccharophila]|uniref:LysM repeat protein n=1 Tax=Roseateles saccharophilus TaxID=304 RepID=A0ABU1YRR7_ROSSA|nr:LysM peptidoglycan-binding domain-containing protein [Roseateles saccharophilus]MDR7270921.1 LysM repeat protein [Roseateles saccharophilus]
MSTISRATSATASLHDAPPSEGGSYEVQRGDSLSGIAAANGVSVNALLAANPQLRNPDVIYPGTKLHLPEPGGNARYTVKPGDNLQHIAADHGLTLNALMAANPQVHNANLIHVGDSLRLPQRHAAATAAHPQAAQATQQPVQGLWERLLNALPRPLYQFSPQYRHAQEAQVAMAPRVGPATAEMAQHTRPADTVAHNTGFDAHNARDRRWLQSRDTLVDAANRTGVDAGVMAMIANFESGFNANARPVARDESRNTVRQFDGTMALSTAHGFGQFTDGTWRQMLREHGADYGVPNAANLTTAQANAYRTDTTLQAGMLAEFTRQNIATGRNLGGRDDVANVYALHNLGGGDGRAFLRTLANDPGTRVDDVLPAAVIRNNASLYGDGSITVEAAYGRMGDAMRAGQRYANDARQVQAEQRH